MKSIVFLILISIAVTASAKKKYYTVSTKSHGSSHEYSTQTIEGSYLLTNEGYGIQADYSTISQKGRMYLYGFSWDNAKLDNGGTIYNTYGLQFAQMYSILNSNNKFYLNLGPGSFLSYETAKNDILNQSKNQFSPGIKAKIECEFYMGKICLFTGAEELYRPFSIVGDWQWRASFGIRYIIK